MFADKKFKPRINAKTRNSLNRESTRKTRIVFNLIRVIREIRGLVLSAFISVNLRRFVLADC
jgi:hypothetical protein